MQHVINEHLEQTVQKVAVNSVLDQTMTAITSMDLVFLDALMDMKENDVKIVSKLDMIINKHIKFCFHSCNKDQRYWNGQGFLHAFIQRGDMRNIHFSHAH